MRKNKQGISLIVLVITIIVMIILAAAIILALNNSGIIDKANEAVGETNLDQVQHVAALIWADAYLEHKDIADEATRIQKIKNDVINELEEQGITEEKYIIDVTDKGVTVTENKLVEIPSDWKASVSTIVDGVPIPVGFAASPYDGEKTKDGGLVIYALTETEITEGKTTITDEHQTALETRNQFVWVPVDSDKFKDEFVRDDFGRTVGIYDDEIGDYIEVAFEPSKELGIGYWELELDEATNMPIQGQNRSYVSEATELEAIAMYKSVKKYGGFYIARYEVGVDKVNSKNFPIGNISITMGKHPYSYVAWGADMIEGINAGEAVTLSRAFYPNNTTNTTGVVSTLTYGVQWDTTLNWWTNIVLEDSTSYGNYRNTSIEEGDYNKNAKYSEFDYLEWHFDGPWNDAVAKEYDEGSYDEGSEEGRYWLLTTGAFKKANINNIYDMAGNLIEWTMEGYSTGDRVHRGGSFQDYGYQGSSVARATYYPAYPGDYIGFRPSLYIK